MSPEQIGIVAASWRMATGQRAQLLAAIGEVLGNCDGWPAVSRAVWLLDAVTTLEPLLSHPAALAEAATPIATCRRACGSDDFACEGDALLAGLDRVLGPLDDTARRAWRQAWHLLAEIFAGMTLAPFAPAPQKAVAS
jgi:hypothetical protein